MKFFTLHIVLLLTACTTNPIPIDPRIIGTWEGKDHTQAHVRYLFNGDGSADIVIDGESFQKKIAPKGQLQFRFDPTKNPARLMVFAKTVRGERLIIIQKIVAFVDDKQIKTKAKLDNTYPAGFSDKNKKTEMLLNRIL